jgi:deoxyribodipyrimidine photo-lyase
MTKKSFAVFWFRRDLRLRDNTALTAALQTDHTVLPVFIFDTTILKNLAPDDARVTFIYDQLVKLNTSLQNIGSGILVLTGTPEAAWKKLADEFDIKQVFFNHDYEPDALNRDATITALLAQKKIAVHTYKDQVFFEKNEIVKPDGSPYTVYTPYKKKWLEKFGTLPDPKSVNEKKTAENFLRFQPVFPSLEEIGFRRSAIQAPDYRLDFVNGYDRVRDFPALEQTTYTGHHLRFGTISVRNLVYFAREKNHTFLSEIIWRDFFSQILFHFPHVANRGFKKQYDHISWENDPALFDKWCNGKTGYPIVDAGMNQLNQTGFMHNRVRMIVASFLVKHLLIDWRWGEAYFAEKLLDFDLASNNGNWQWAAGCGCDAAPYFRVFNPTIQQEKFDPEQMYIRKWIPGFDPGNYIKPIVEHVFARDRAIKRFKEGIESAK